MRPLLPCLALVAGCAAATAIQAPPGADAGGWAELTDGLERRPGLLAFYPDPERRRLLLEVPAADAGGIAGSYLYVEGLVTGLGSNPVGLDRGQLGETRVVDLRRLGGRVVVEERNLRYRALSTAAAEQRAVRESFATSVLWAGDVLAVAADGRALVDFTSFVVRDAHGVARALADAGQGSFALDAGRSAVDFDACLAFPDNLELEALLTFGGDAPGPLVRETAPSPGAVSLVQHHSLIRLPDAGYRPRRFDPRMGSFAVSFADYAAGLGEPIEQRWIVRHRLQRAAPGAPSSPVVEPLVYYVDPAIPEPVLSAVVEGAGWWAEAFAAAGFDDAFSVELLPEGAHPLDARYNVIQWVHRSTRGWSYGGGIVDPRTGEMVKGHVSLGSLRVRQDRLLFEGLAGTERTGSGAADDPIELALARIRQLAAHEVGHTLGFAHNFAASVYGDRASVMDYPAPRVALAGDDGLDFADAYGRGLGAWDLHAANWAYREFPPGADEAAELAAIVADGLARGHLFLTDEDARPAAAAHPLANLWDNGADPVAELAHVLEVRRRALARFGERNVAPGAPLALLEEVLAPLYLHHRYQVEATVKLIGGLEYGYALRGDGQPPPAPVAPQRQRAALAALLGALAPAALDVPEPVLAVLAPRPFGYGDSVERFRGAAGPAFDALAAATTAADLVVSGLLVPQRLNRVGDLHRRDPAQPAVSEVLAALVEAAWTGAAAGEPRHATLGRAVVELVVGRLIELAGAEAAAPPVRAAAEEAVAGIAERLPDAAWGADGEAQARALARAVERFLERDGPSTVTPAVALPPPPGAPIGDGLPTLAGCSRGAG